MSGDRFTDSAGVPWDGRHFEPNPHAGDEGLADAGLIAALEAFQLDGNRPELVVDALRSARLLVPLLAHLGASEEGAHGKTVDKSAELSIVTVLDPDGNPAIPVFSSVVAMNQWNPKARPVVSDIVRICLASAQENGHSGRVILDPTSESEFALRRPAIWALANQKPWLAAFNDPEVEAQVKQSLTKENAIVRSFRLTAGDPESRLKGRELAVVIWLEPGLTAKDLKDLETRLMQAWQLSEVLLERADSVSIVYRSAAEL